MTGQQASRGEKEGQVTEIPETPNTNLDISSDPEQHFEAGQHDSSRHSHPPSDTIEAAPREVGDLEQVKSNVPSVVAPLVIVPREDRRGLFGRFTIIPEVANPYVYERKTKWIITLLVSLAGGAAPIGSAILMPALPDVALDLNTTPKITNLSVALFILSTGVFPLWWSSFSETLGRRSIYLVSFSLFTLWSIVSALSSSMAMLIVMRLLSGGAAASVQAVGAGTIADIWETRERGRAMGIFYLGPLLGPLLAPIIGGALAQRWNWRSTQWFQSIYGGLLILILTVCLPETLAVKAQEVAVPTDLEGDEKRPALTRVSTRQSVHLKTKKVAKYFKRCIIDPLSVLLYLRFPAVFLTVYLSSTAFGALYVLNISIQQTFSSPPYSFPLSTLGLLYVPSGLGYLTASVLGGRWTDHIMAREAKAAGRYDHQGKLIYIPEDRMRENAWIAAVMYPGALVWYGWTAEKGIAWIVPTIANFFFGFGSMIIFGSATTMLTEFMPKKSSSGVALNNFVRSLFSCVGGIVANPLIDAIGNGWLFTGLGVICWVSAFGVVWAMRRFGPKWRITMDQELKI